MTLFPPFPQVQNQSLNFPRSRSAAYGVLIISSFHCTLPCSLSSVQKQNVLFDCQGRTGKHRLYITLTQEPFILWMAKLGLGQFEGLSSPPVSSRGGQNPGVLTLPLVPYSKSIWDLGSLAASSVCFKLTLIIIQKIKASPELWLYESWFWKMGRNNSKTC